MLAQIIQQNLNPVARTVVPLRGGLNLIFYPRDATFSRIVATRKGVEPGDRELDTLRREIETAVADVPLCTVGSFQRLAAKDDYQAAEIWVNFAPVSEGRSG